MLDEYHPQTSSSEKLGCNAIRNSRNAFLQFAHTLGRRQFSLGEKHLASELSSSPSKNSSNA